MDERQQHEPMFQAPPIVMAVLGVVIALHAVRQFAGNAVDDWLLVHLAFFTARFQDSALAPPGPAWLGYTSLAAHALLHGDWLHLIFNGAWLLAFGAMIARRTGPVNFLILFAICAIAGALLFIVMNLDRAAVIVGASGAISGLMGAAFRILFSAMDWGGITTLQHMPNMVPRMPLVVALQDRRVLTSIAAWIGINLVFGILVPGVFTSSGIAWEAHIGGFAAGFLLFGLFDRGRGWTNEIPAGSNWTAPN